MVTACPLPRNASKPASKALQRGPCVRIGLSRTDITSLIRVIDMGDRREYYEKGQHAILVGVLVSRERSEATTAQ